MEENSGDAGSRAASSQRRARYRAAALLRRDQWVDSPTLTMSRTSWWGGERGEGRGGEGCDYATFIRIIICTHMRRKL